MIQVPGFSASDKWDTLSLDVKELMVSQVADHLMEIFTLRFDCAGSLYLSAQDESGFVVGPIVSTPFFHAIDGVVRAPESDADVELSGFRGPFTKTSDYLQSSPLTELHFIAHHRSIALSELSENHGDETKDATALLEQGERALRKVLELCLVYPASDLPIQGQDATPLKPFSLRLDDFRLSNIMVCPILVFDLQFQLPDIHIHEQIDESGQVTGLIDFEGATISPLWECALLPRWLQDPDDPEGSYEGGPAEDRQVPREHFLKKVQHLNEEWGMLHERGKPFRMLCDRLNFDVNVWATSDMEAWVDKMLAWAKEHPGVGLVEPEWLPDMDISQYCISALAAPGDYEIDSL